MVVVDKVGVVNDGVPVAKAVPPDAVEYQSIVSPVPGVAEMLTVPAAHLEFAVPAGALGRGFTVSVTEHELWHPFAFVTVTV